MNPGTKEPYEIACVHGTRRHKACEACEKDRPLAVETPKHQKRAPRANEVRVLAVDDVYPNPEQPRQIFDIEKLQELAESIVRHGLLQPIRVRPDGKGRYMVILGERRWRAHQLAGISKIACTVMQVTDDELAEAAIVENLQRADISPLEEARAFQKRLDTGLTPEELAERLGLKQPWRVTERTNLLKLAPEFQDALAKGLITPSQGTELSRLEHGYQRLLFQAINQGRCKTYAELRAVAGALIEAQKRNAADGFSLTGDESKGADDQRDLFPGLPEPTPEERAVVRRMEAKIQRVVELLQGGFKDNEVVIARKVSAQNADTMAEQLELIEKQLSKLRLALRAAATVNGRNAA